MRAFMLVSLVVVLEIGFGGRCTVAFAQPKNLLVVTVDDMSADSIGAFDGVLPEATPEIDAFAMQSLRFKRAHVVVGNCMPSRNVFMSGLYPHHNGVDSFVQNKKATHPILVDLMKEAGFFTAIRGKVSHSTPYLPYGWDLVLDESDSGRKLHIKDPSSYGESTKTGIEAARQAGKPFCLVINISDPHKPFYAEGKGGVTVDDPHVPSRVFTPHDVPVPAFLFDDPVSRKELSHYYSSVRRADDAFASIMKALDGVGAREETMIMFFSDHGMPLPFAKTQLYHHSTHTPLVISVPGLTVAGAVDDTHMVSAVDFLPTILEVFGIQPPARQDGKSFASLLSGNSQSGREVVFKSYSFNFGHSEDPMRGVQTKKYLYLFNPWSDGKRVMKTATQGTSTYRRMKELAKIDLGIAARLELIDHRVMEELYDVELDPDCLHNLVEVEGMESVLADMQMLMKSKLEELGDPLLSVFLSRNDKDAMAAYVAQLENAGGKRKQKAEGE